MKTFILSVTYEDSVDSAHVNDTLLNAAESICPAPINEEHECVLIAASITSRQHTDEQFVDYDLVVKDWEEDDDADAEASESADEG